jgi:hypothetical protein
MVSMLFGLLLASAGFAAAAIGSHGKLLSMLTGTSSTNMTATAPGQRLVTLCHRTHSSKHPWHTITVSQNAVAAHLRYGDYLGQCVVAPATTSSSTTTTTTSSDMGGERDDDHGISGHDSNHGNSGQDGPGNSGQSASAHGHKHGD